MPPGGKFAAGLEEAKMLIYFAPGLYTPPARRGSMPGLYLSQDGGLTWKLVCSDHSFREVFLHKSGGLYALAARKPEDDYATQMLLSKDLGRTWRDITGKAALEFVGLFRDPDHSELVCVEGQGLRAYVLQAQNGDYEWQIFREWEWWEKHETDEHFFQPSYSSTWRLYYHEASLATFFERAFPSWARLPALELATERDTYRFEKQAEKIVPVEIRFWRADCKVKLVDLTRAPECFGLRVVDAEGKRIETWSPAIMAISKARETLPEVQAEYRRREDFIIRELSKGHSYRRSVDLGKLYDFGRPGTYRVQLEYNSLGLAERERGEWPGSFRSRVITVTITD